MKTIGWIVTYENGEQETILIDDPDFKEKFERGLKAWHSRLTRLFTKK